jgi:hypothetical protein
MCLSVLTKAALYSLHHLKYNGRVNRLTTSQGDTDNCMNNSNSSSNPPSPRVTLSLKTGARKSPRETKTPPAARPQNTGKLKPGAHWSDEYKERMQADMDALLR